MTATIQNKVKPLRFGEKSLRGGSIVKRPVHLPQTMIHQKPILDDDSRFKVIIAGRRFGKSMAALIACLDGHGSRRQFKGAIDGGNIWWIAPNYRQSMIFWRLLKRATRNCQREKSELDKRVELYTGGSVTIRSADGRDSLRGDGLDGLVIDELAYIRREVWTEDLRPALSDKRGWAMLIGSPNGMEHWSYELFQSAATRHNWQRWQVPTWMNPLIDKDEIEDARIDLGSLAFAQEYGAEFISTLTALFKFENFRYYEQGEEKKDYILRDPHDELAQAPDNANTRGRTAPRSKISRVVTVADCARFATVDLAASLKTSADYTVISIWDSSPEEDLILVDVIRDRFSGNDHLPLLERAHKRHNIETFFIEATGYQLSLVQRAIAAGLPVEPIKADKDKVSRALVAAARVENHKVWFPAIARDWLDAIESEMRVFPNGAHDDFVDTLAYAAIHQIQPPPPMGNIRQL